MEQFFHLFSVELEEEERDRGGKKVLVRKSMVFVVWKKRKTRNPESFEVE
jgi:hypothetical protein